MTDPSDIRTRALTAHAKGTAGDFRASEALICELEVMSSTLAQAWSLALKAQRWHAQPEQGELPTLASQNPFIDEAADVRTAAAFACTEAAKQAVLAHDVTALGAWTALHQQLARDCDDETAACWTTMLHAWLALAGGEYDKAHESATHAQAQAAQHEIAPAVIEATVIRALCAEAQGDLAEATALARRGSRMARTEDLPQWQYLANLVLARMRRLNGMPHLTTRILRPLLQVAPAPWHGWIAWEALLGGALPFAEAIELDDQNDSSGHVRLLRSLLDAAAKGSASRFASAKTEVFELDPVWVSRKRDLGRSLTAIDANTEIDDADSELAGWCLGTVPTPPGSICGLCVDARSAPNGSRAAAFVLARPLSGPDVRNARRIAVLGEPVVHVDGPLQRLDGESERTLSTLAAAALAGPRGIDRSDLFLAVYGFEYDEELHEGLFRVMIHRTRKELGDFAELNATQDDRYILEPDCTLLIADPRCTESPEDVVLRALARGAQSAKDASAQSGLALRSTQRALKRLVESGALISERVANEVTYQVEDTTFSEPTKWS